MKTKIPGVIFKVKKSNSHPKRPGIILKKSKTSVQKFNKHKNRLSKLILVILALLVFLAISIGGSFLAYNYIKNLRAQRFIQNSSNEKVYGFPEIPAYPNSEFIFKDSLEKDDVKTFLSLGNSVYRIAKDVSFSSVTSFYNEALKSLGWEHVLSVPVESEEKMYGEYWIKGDKGLRIYSRLNDIWYQSLSIEEAKSGQEDLVKRETERKLLLLTTEKTELLPDFPWRLSFPSEYTTKYYNTDFDLFQGVYFQKLGSDKKVYIEPLGYYGAISLDAYITKYLKNYNKKNNAKWTLISSIDISLDNNVGLKGKIRDGSNDGQIIVIKNSVNTMVYALVTFEKNDPFYEYIITNIKASTLN